MKDRQYDAVTPGVEELVGVPTCGRWSGLGLSVAHYAGHYEVRVVEGSPEGMAQRIAELPALMDRSWGLRAGVAGDAAGEGELTQELAHSLPVTSDVGIALAVGTFQPGVRHDGWRTVARAAHKEGF